VVSAAHPARRLLAAAVAVLVGLALAAPTEALAHATLEGVEPQRGAVLDTQPNAVQFRFDEPVEGNFGAVRVFDRDGGRVDAGDAYHPAGRGERIAVHVKPRLPDGTYTATYRVVSADGHMVSGGSAFSIGAASATSKPVSELLGDASTGPVTQTGLGIAKGLTFAAIAVAVGGLGFLLWTWSACVALVGVTGDAATAFLRRMRLLLVGASVAGAAGAAGVVVLQGATAAGISGWSALDPAIVRETLGTRVGGVWGAAVPVWLAAAALFAVILAPARRLPVRRGAGVLGAALLFLVLVPGLGGHAGTQDPTWLMLPANAVHVGAVSLWVGGLVALVAMLPAAIRRLDPPGRTKLLAGALARFSPMALACVIVLICAGLVQAYVEVRTPAHLLDTAFGRAVLVKSVLLLALIAVGAWHRRTGIPRIRELAATDRPTGGAGLAVRRALRAEIALIVVVFGVTAALSSYAPSVAETSGPFSTTTTVGPAQLQLTVDPAAVGSNEIHLYLLDPRGGGQWNRAKEVRISAVQREKGIGPLPERVSKAGPGHYVVPAAVLGVAGDWTLNVAIRVSAFDQYEREIDVPIP
jgi:copper transport protein